MRRNHATQFDPTTVVDMNCDPDLDPEGQAEARKLLHGVFGPHAEYLIRACGQAAAGRREAAQLREQLARAASAPQLRAIVTGTHNGRVRLLIGGTERLLVRPEGMTLGVGQTALTDGEGRSVVAAGDFLVGGQSYVFCEALEDRYALVRPLREGPADDSRQLALISDNVDAGALAAGDRVLGWSIDWGNIVLVTRRLGPIRAAVADDVGVGRDVSRDDVVGLEDVLAEAELLFLPLASGAYAAMLDQVHRALVGCVFQGPSGCGKSTLAEVLVNEVRRRGGRALYRTASYYLVKWVGEGAANLRADFALLDASYRETGVRPLLVVDELEAIALDRTQAGALAAGHLDVLDTLLSLLTRTEARMIGISNVANRFLESALLRDGRLRMVRFPSTLGAEQVAVLVAKTLSGVPLAGDEGRPEAERRRVFGDALSDLVFAPSGELAELLRVQLADGRVLRFGARDLASAAAIADGVIRPTLARTARRDWRAGLPAPRPLALEELRQAAVDYFTARCAAITRDNVRSVLAERIPDGQAVVRVEQATKGAG